MVKQVFADKIDDKKLIEIKIPVKLPAIQDWTEYAAVQGQIQLKDAYYNFVRLKVTQDTMYFICFANAAKTRLVNANVIVAKQINDVPLSKKSQGAPSKKLNTLSEYNLLDFHYRYLAFGLFLKLNNKPISARVIEPFIESPGKPPNFVS